jgi:hypothetical protein
MVVDCRHSALKGYYLDSMDSIESQYSLNQLLALYILRGLQLLLNDDGHKHSGVSKDDIIVDGEAPSQGSDNANSMKDGLGACGPFIWLMAKEYTQYIVECKEDGAKIDLKLPVNFAKRLQWNSRQTRQTLQNLINRELRVRNWLANRDWWFNENTGEKRPGWRSWLTARGIPLNKDWFWDPYETSTELRPQFGRPR